jgi:hypothetical protein
MGARRKVRRRCSILLLLLLANVAQRAVAVAPQRDLEEQVVVVQVPRERAVPPGGAWEAGILRHDYGDGARIVLVHAGEVVRVLTEDFHSAADPDISFDGRRMIFAARPGASDDWDIFEMELDGHDARQITQGLGDCRQPVYQGTLYTIVSTEPWHQITFVSTAAGELNEHGALPSTSLYSCRLDGSAVQRLTYNPSADLDPAVLPDGRLVFSSWQRSTLGHGIRGRISLFAAHTDGLDYALFSGAEGLGVKLMPAATTEGLVVFVEGDVIAPDGSGSLASVSLAHGNMGSFTPRRRWRTGQCWSRTGPGTGGRRTACTGWTRRRGGWKRSLTIRSTTTCRRRSLRPARSRTVARRSSSRRTPSARSTA